MRACVYVDGFNLFYGALKGHRGRLWLNVEELAQRLIGSNDTLEKVVYCTARIKPNDREPRKHIRQSIYLEALATLPRVRIIEGRYQQGRKTVYTIDDPPEKVTILKREEKVSDVNLASHLLLDAFRNEFDKALVITNDSDLTTPVRMARSELSKLVVVVNPRMGKASKDLWKAASECRHIRAAVIEACQFPDKVVTQSGRVVSKPSVW